MTPICELKEEWRLTKLKSIHNNGFTADCGHWPDLSVNFVWNQVKATLKSKDTFTRQVSLVSFVCYNLQEGIKVSAMQVQHLQVWEMSSWLASVHYFVKYETC